MQNLGIKKKEKRLFVFCNFVSSKNLFLILILNK